MGLLSKAIEIRKKDLIKYLTTNGYFTGKNQEKETAKAGRSLERTAKK